MAASEHPQRIHPVDVESGTRAGAGAPLMPRNSVRSHDSDPDSKHPYYPTGPPPYHTHPTYGAKPPRRRCNPFCRCLCWTLCLLLALIVLSAITLGALYLIYRPKVPSYSVDRLRITTFSIDPASNAQAAFEATVTATNPNAKIGVYYEPGSSLQVAYGNATLCQGHFPAFYQGHRNVTVFPVVLEGRTRLGDGIAGALQAAQTAGAVPLDFRGDVPVKVKLGALKLWKVRIIVTCRVVVSSLVVDQQISIRSSSCKFNKIKM